MSKRLLITIILLLTVNLMPIAYYLLKRSASLSDNEKMVQLVFEKQVESILFSLNQETENMVNQWINNIDLPVDYSGSLPETITKKLFLNNQALKQIEIKSLRNKQFNEVYSSNDSLFNIPGISKNTLNSLSDFIKDNYQKIHTERYGDEIVFTFFLKSGNNDLYCSILADLEMIVSQNLRQKVQQTAQDIFVISVYDSINNSTLYSTDPLVISDSRHQTVSWYLPGIKFSIQLKTQTIEDLVKKRNKAENNLLIALFLLSLIGTLIIVLTIRKTIRVNNMKSEFIANVSHELRTPLALISMYSETLQMGRIKDEEKKMHYLNVINEETGRLSGLVNRILNFSKIEKKKRTYHIEEVKLNEVVRHVISNWEPHFKANNVNCSYTSTCEGVTVMADREALTETIINLLDNAIKYSKDDDKRIEIKCLPLNNRVVLEIHDNGIGISKRNQRKIFDKFYRVTKGNLANKVKGAGLGLNIVLNNMKAFGGKVKVSSEPGKKSCFSLIFPSVIKK